MTTDDQCFDSTRVFPFSGSDHHLIVSHFYSRGICVDPPSHRFVVVRNFLKLDLDKLDELLPVMTFGVMLCQDLITFPIAWSVLI